jgi:hypothetical protein
MTEEELNNLGQMIQRCVPKGTTWIVVAVPPHDAAGHEPGCCPVQTASNMGCTREMHWLLDGAAVMFEHGPHEPMFAHSLEQGN